MSAGATALRTALRPPRIGPLLRPLARPAEVPESDSTRLPQRYRIGEEDGVRVLRCPEAPTLRVRAERGLSFSERDARGAAPGTIFLDGVAAAPPFADLERQVLNLDHHEGCVRAFTLSCCEQALVLLRKGLDLRRREWTIYANDGDLDTLLALWLLLNHLRLDEAGGIARARVLPLLRLEGAIDAHGLDCADLCALPPDLLEHARAQMQRLRAPELALRSSGDWASGDLLQYLAGRLRVLDAIAYSPGQLRDVGEVDELARSEIGRGKIAVVCRSELGIYEVERQLRRFHGARLGVIALMQESQKVTLRQVDYSLPATLKKLYAQLNWVDSAAGGRHSGNRWGGSAEIGGSPRQSGTRLDARQIAEVCRIAYRVPGRGARLARGAAASALAFALPLAAARTPELVAAAAPWIPTRAAFPCALLVASLIALGLAARRAPRAFGLALPTATRALALAPLALALGLCGAAWLPREAANAVGARVAQLLAIALGSELLFRGWLHGALASALPETRSARSWTLPLWIGVCSASAMLAAQLGASAGLGTAETAWLARAGLAPALPWLPAPAIGTALLAAFGFGALQTWLRERSGSLAPPIAVHVAAAFAAAFAA